MKKTDAIEPTAKAQLTGKQKTAKVFKGIFNTIINILIVVVLVVSLLIAVMALTSKADGVSQMFGYTIQTIQSDSMKGSSPDGYEGGDFEAGDLVIGKSTNFDEYAEYSVGDIITYRGVDAEDVPYLMAHRIVDKVTGDDGYYRYQTWGDNREVSEVPDQLSEDQYLAAYDIASVIYDDDYHGAVIKGVGGFLDKLKTDRLFFFLVILLPMIAFFLYAMIRVVLNAINFRKTREKELIDNAEKEKQEAVEAAVKAALEAQSKTETSPVGDDTHSVPSASADISAEQMEQFKQFMAFQEAQKAAADAQSADAPAEAVTAAVEPEPASAPADDSDTPAE